MRIKAETPLKNGRKLLAWWANNCGRGSDNCTLAVVDAADIGALDVADIIEKAAGRFEHRCQILQ